IPFRDGIKYQTRILHMLPRAVYRKLLIVEEIPTNELMLPLQFSASIITLVQPAFSALQLIYRLTHVLRYGSLRSLKKRKTDGFKEMGIIEERRLKIQTRYFLCSLFGREHYNYRL
ncbi:unnamed protein product, partial [Heterotrigona itama]